MKMLIRKLFKDYPIGAYEVNFAHVQEIKDMIQKEREGLNRYNRIAGMIDAAKIVLPPIYHHCLK